MSELLPELGPIEDNEQDITVRIQWEDGLAFIVGVTGRIGKVVMLTSDYYFDAIAGPSRFGLTPPERTFDVVVKLTETQVRGRAAGDFVAAGSVVALNKACAAIVAELDGEVES